ncbi:MAG: hypothetical protein K2Q26_01255 [Bdellovibrionales bacterium]|nr:hypothetical protein [Bdellovibrionales bacterium]
MLSLRLITFYPSLILAVLLGGASMAWSQTPAPEVVAEKPAVLSFLEWKSMRVHEAQKKLEQVNKTDEQKLSFNVDVALQLTVQDYFSMYLKNLSPEEFKEAVKKLVPDESAELLMAYRNSLEKDKKVPLKFSKSPKDNATQKLPEI